MRAGIHNTTLGKKNIKYVQFYKIKYVYLHLDIIYFYLSITWISTSDHFALKLKSSCELHIYWTIYRQQTKEKKISEKKFCPVCILLGVRSIIVA